jgi:Protein of unknown function (DUF421)
MSMLRSANFKPRERRLMPRETFPRKRDHRDIRSPKFFVAIKFPIMNAFWNFFGPLLGLGARPEDLTFVQISLRGIIVFLATLFMIRIGHKRSLSRKTAFDAVLIIILASVLSRAINGSAAFFATIGGGLVLVLVHRLLAFIAYYSHWFGVLIKGSPDVIIEDGDLIPGTMRRNHISRHDVEEDLRLAAKTGQLKDIRIGYVERSGDISFVEK